MIKEEYSPFKIIHHPDKLEQLKLGVQTVPLQLQIIPTNLCNQRCSFCAYRMKGYLSNESFSDRDTLSYEKIEEILDDCVGMRIPAVQYTGGGEPLVHSKIKQIFRDTIYRDLEFSLVTNGMALDEELCTILSESLWNRISVDCAKPTTYSEIRGVDKKIFNKVIGNIETLVKHKKKNIIGVGFVVNKDNYKEVYDAAKLFKSLGVDNMRISASFTPSGYEYFKDFLDDARYLSKKAESLSDDRFTVFNLFGDRIKDSFEGTQKYDYCPTKELMAYVGADYNVYTCCTLAYNEKGLIGSIADRSFRDLWTSYEKMEMFHNHCASKICTFPCLYGGKNEFINYCISKDPKHINFI